MRKVLSPLLFLNKELRDQALTVVLAVRKYNLYLWELYSLPSLLVQSFPAVEVLTLAPDCYRNDPTHHFTAVNMGVGVAYHATWGSQ